MTENVHQDFNPIAAIFIGQKELGAAHPAVVGEFFAVCGNIREMVSEFTFRGDPDIWQNVVYHHENGQKKSPNPHARATSIDKKPGGHLVIPVGGAAGGRKPGA